MVFEEVYGVHIVLRRECCCAFGSIFTLSPVVLRLSSTQTPITFRNCSFGTSNTTFRMEKATGTGVPHECGVCCMQAKVDAGSRLGLACGSTRIPLADAGLGPAFHVVGVCFRIYRSRWQVVLACGGLPDCPPLLLGCAWSCSSLPEGVWIGRWADPEHACCWDLAGESDDNFSHDTSGYWPEKLLQKEQVLRSPA